MIKKLQYLIVCISIFTIMACNSKNNDITNPTKDDIYNNNNDNNTMNITTSYTINGIDEKYSGNWKFFNADDTGNTAVDITIENGGINGLVISNAKSQNKVNFAKEHIYSTPTPEENQYYDRYFGYIISDGIWLGEIHFPTYDDETVGYIYATNKNTSDIIIGMIDKAPSTKEGIEQSFQGTFNANNDDKKRSLNITKDFVIYLENGEVKLKIPSSFLEPSKGFDSYGYTLFVGILYNAVWLNSDNATSTPTSGLYFECYDDNYKLEIQLRDDGVPISAKYNKKITTISPDKLLYVKQ